MFRNFRRILCLAIRFTGSLSKLCSGTDTDSDQTVGASYLVKIFTNPQNPFFTQDMLADLAHCKEEHAMGLCRGRVDREFSPESVLVRLVIDHIRIRI